MKTQRSFASLCLAASCCALVFATNASVGEQPGVVRISAQQTINPPVPPAGDADDAGSVQITDTPQPGQQGAPGVPQGNGAPPLTNAGPPLIQNGAPPFVDPQAGFNTIFAQSGAATAPVVGRLAANNALPGPSVTWQSNIGQGVGFGDSFHTLNARVPIHIIPDITTLNIDLSGSISDQNDEIFNLGLVLREFNEDTNQILGVNAFYDSQRGNQGDWSRFGAGFEYISQFFELRANSYFIQGNPSVLQNDVLLGNLVQTGNTITQGRQQTRLNAYSGADLEIGGPLPILGRRGVNGFIGAYYLDSDFGEETVGYSVRAQLFATESATVSVTGTDDDTFGTNVFVSLSYTIPNYFENQILQPRQVRRRLVDPVQRSNRVHTNVEVTEIQEAVLRTLESKNGLPAISRPWNLVYVDPNGTSPGTGTFEDPFNTLAAADALNDAGPGIDVIQVVPRADDTGINLTVPGGFDVREEQFLVSSTQDVPLFVQDGVPFILGGTPTPTGLGPLISDPTLANPTDSVIRINSWSTVAGIRVDASATDALGQTTFGQGISSTGPVSDVTITANEITNFTRGIDLNGISGDVIIDQNTLTGTLGTSQDGILLTTTVGSQTALLLQNNTVTDVNALDGTPGDVANGIGVTVTTGSTLTADNPAGLARAIGVPESPSGILGNTVTGSGDGIAIDLQAGARADVVADNNTSSGNAVNGFRADSNGAGAVFNLASLADNTFADNELNGAFLRFRNGGAFISLSEEINEDANLNGALDVGEDLDGDLLLDVSNGLLDPGEDLNGNGRLDHGIVGNNFSGNLGIGLCIVGDGTIGSILNGAAPGDADTGFFDIGGDTANLGNTFTNNQGAGIAVDLNNNAVAQLNTVNNIFQGGGGLAGPPVAPSLTIVLDFVEPGQTPSVGPGGFAVNPFDITAFGLTQADFTALTTMVRNTVEDQFLGIPTMGVNALSPIPDGFELDIDFVIGDQGVPPSNGATEFFTLAIGENVAAAAQGILGIAGLSAVRDANGNGPNFGVMNGDHVGSTFSNLSAVSSLPLFMPGNITQAANLLANTTSHEIGHTLSLNHVDPTTTVTASGVDPLLSAFANPVTNLMQLEFSFSGESSVAGMVGAPTNNVAQLVSAVGLRPVAAAAGAAFSGDGIAITARDNSRLLPGRFLNNTFDNNGGDGLSINVQDNAQAQDVTIQGNQFLNNTGRGIDLVANGPNALIEASNTIGGLGMNSLAGLQFPQGNVIDGNTSDGIRALAQMGGTINGNVIGNTITNNGGNGVALAIDVGGNINFGNVANNQVISGNTITGNALAGISLVSNVDVTVTDAGQQMDVIVQGNNISMNAGGGLLAELNGVNNVPPGPPAAGSQMNNVLNLTVGQEVPASPTPFTFVNNPLFANTFDQNGGVGIGVVVNGTGLANVNIAGNNVTGTTVGPAGPFDGDGIGFVRRDSSLLLANVFNNVVTGNVSNGLEVDAQGTSRTNQNQPILNAINSVNWNNNVFMNNLANGVSFQTRGDAQLVAHGISNVASNNSLSGVLVTTSEFSTFGDPLAAQTTIPGSIAPLLPTTVPPLTLEELAPGIDTSVTHSLFVGLIADGNGRDGVELQATESSSLLAAITSRRLTTDAAAHPTLITAGNTSISNNGRDGVHIESGGVSGVNGTPGLSMPDVLITGEVTPTLPITTEAITVIDGNGTAGAGGNGIFWDAFNGSNGIVRVFNSTISGSISGLSEDTNGDGILTFAEDTAGNFGQNQIVPGAPAFQAGINGNLDIDVANGDGIQFNSFQGSSDTLQVGQIIPAAAVGAPAVQLGNLITNNQDDGIAITTDITRISNTFPTVTPPATSSVTLVGAGPTPTVNIQGNMIVENGTTTLTRSDGDGVSIRSFGSTAAGFMPAAIDSSVPPADMDGLTFEGGAADIPGQVTQGSAPDITLDNNLISLNGRNGVNIRLNGANGLTNLRPNPIALFAGFGFINEITLTQNTITSNGQHGIITRTDADLSQNRFIFVPNLETPLGSGNFNPPIAGFGVIDALSPFPAGDTSPLFPFLNFGTVQNSILTVTENTIQNNGTNTLVGVGHGIELRAGTSTFLAADIRDNIFGGNLETDFTTSAIASDVSVVGATATRNNTFTSVNNMGDGTNDIVFLDDAALLDVRFSGNTGDQIAPMEDFVFGLASTATGAVVELSAFNNNANPFTGTGAGARAAGVFKIDDTINLNLTGSGNNFFLQPGGAIGAAFAPFDLQNLQAEPIFPEDPFLDVD